MYTPHEALAYLLGPPAALTDADALQALAALAPQAPGMDATVFATLVAQVRQQASVQSVLASLSVSNPFWDCCGTGGSGLLHYNTSTTVAFVLAAMGVPMLKFGSRSASSASGSFDFLSLLGYPLDCPLERVLEKFYKTGLGFVFAPTVYPALAALAPYRKQFGQKTIFNLMGPLLHPYAPPYRLLGCAQPQFHPWLVSGLQQQQGFRQAWVVSGGSPFDGQFLDEISPTYATHVTHVTHVSASQHVVSTLSPVVPTLPWPADLPAAMTPAHNVDIFKRIVQGQDLHSFYSHSVQVNAALVWQQHAQQLFEKQTFEQALAQVQAALASGRVNQFVAAYLA